MMDSSKTCAVKSTLKTSGDALDRSKGVLHCRSMKQSTLVTGLVVLLMITATCDNSERMARLEKQNQELQAEVSKSRATTDYDLQSKCSQDARSWFNENYSRDKDTILLDFSNHYNKNLNKCFIVVEFHYSYDALGSWTNSMTLWDVYENAKCADFAQNTTVFTKPTYRTEKKVIVYEVRGKTCTTVQEFNNFIHSYLTD